VSAPRFRRVLRMKHLLPLTLLLAGCVADPEAPDDDAEVPSTLTLVASVQRDNGNVFEVYVEDDGSVTLSESGPVANAPSLSPHDALAFTSLDTSDALARLDAIPSIATAPGAAPATCSSQWFQTKVCNELPDEDKNWCLLDRTTNSTASDDDYNEVFAMACADKGDIVFQRRFRFWWDWTTDEWTVKENHWRWWTKSNSAADFDFQSRVREGDGKLHQHAGYGCNHNLASCPLILPPVVNDD
jgi:hypothetical protein